ncbi:response regulator [Desulfococcaceae bacterium HSG8]|nr:response regulator [Desulfococcaceae bacterium HSG8]
MENIRVLLVDDEENFRDVMARRLGKRGVIPGKAESGEKCLSVLEKEPADVVVLDVKMPGMDGLEVLRHLREKHPGTEVILLTGHATTSDGVQGIKSGAFDYLTKPVEFEHLLGKIKQAWEKTQWLKEKQRETEFREKMAKQMIVTERLASLGTLATGVAHEINNPLAIIAEAAGWMGLLLKKEELSGMPRKTDFENALKKIESSVERAKRITHQLLDFVQKDNSVLSEVDIKELVEGSLRLLNREILNKDVEIIQKIKHGVGSIRSDSYQLRQVLINLLTNAIHAIGTCGKITISCKSVSLPSGPEIREKREKVSSVEAVELRVQDTGEGVPKENLKKIFDPFFSTKIPGKGTGLGLFVTSGIIDKLGGNIEVESQVGQGAVFCITLPRYHKIEQQPENNSRSGFLEKIGFSVNKFGAR